MDLGDSFNPNYFSLPDILASHVRVPCKTEVPLMHFGFLDPALASEDLPANISTELPLWAAQVMSKANRKYVTAELPKLYKESYRDALKADPGVVDLNKMSPNFYQSGLHLSTLNHREAEEVGAILPTVLQVRLRSMADSFLYETKLKTADDENGVSGLKESHMDALEHKIFEDSKKSYKSLLSWLEKPATT
ncbi:unnamed protein product [Allacma fusca]|uniref:DNA replication complex GINS protein PSF3 n=1 Tax=Allacma fusca TaxID=39272 RepID=A0A8J2K097_9HEXA|nr:unnamed protein product [Allacma fusca]